MKIKKAYASRGKILAVAMALAMLFSVALPMAPVSAAPVLGPVAVDGRILTPDKTGDVVNWVEIAQYGNYSLIVRSSYLNIIGGSYYGNPAVQYFAFGTNTRYLDSFVRTRINNWFSGIPAAPAWEDNLYIGARLRDYTMQHSALGAIGTCNTLTALYDGLSMPTPYQVGIGNDIAFALSYSECANFLSNIYFQRNNSLADQPSNYFAAINMTKVKIPDPNPNFYSMWLRSTGDLSNTVGILGNEGRGRFRVFQQYINDTTMKGLIYPALWVNDGIFGTTVTTYDVTYYPNGGIGSVNRYPTNANTNHLVYDQGYTNGTMVFTGWNTEANGSGTTYQNFDVINVTRDINLYAQWRRETVSAVVYHANGGDGTDYVDNGSAGTFTIRSNMFTRPLYQFVGWNTSPDGSGAILPPGLTFSNFMGTLNLYAIWNRIY